MSFFCFSHSIFFLFSFFTLRQVSSFFSDNFLSFFYEKTKRLSQPFFTPLSRLLPRRFIPPFIPNKNPTYLMPLHNPTLTPPFRRRRHNPPLITRHIPRKLLHGAMFANPQARAYCLQHRHVVTDHQHAALEFLQGEGKGVHGFDVQVVGRFVEYEDVRVGER